MFWILDHRIVRIASTAIQWQLLLYGSEVIVHLRQDKREFHQKMQRRPDLIALTAETIGLAGNSLDALALDTHTESTKIPY